MKLLFNFHLKKIKQNFSLFLLTGVFCSSKNKKCYNEMEIEVIS